MIKKSLVGVGRADKEQVSFMVGRVLGVKPDWAVDTGDALAAALEEYRKIYPPCAARHNQLAAEIEQREKGLTP